MRVIAGEFRSRLLKTLPGMDVRPTPDRLREALFNVLAPRIEGTVFIDAYAGSGAVGIEALSRGARKVIFLERSKLAAGVIRQNLKSLGLGMERADVVVGKAAQAVGKYPADILFFDPPYQYVAEYDMTLNAAAAGVTPLVIAQHDTHARLDDVYGKLRRYRTLKQGDNVLSFYAVELE